MIVLAGAAALAVLFAGEAANGADAAPEAAASIAFPGHAPGAAQVAATVNSAELSNDALSADAPVAKRAFNGLTTLPAVSAKGASIPLPIGASVTQTFKLRPDDFLAGLAIQSPADATTTCTVSQISFKADALQKAPAEIRVELFTLKTDGTPVPVASEDFHKQFMGQTVHSFTFAKPATLPIGTPCQLRLTLLKGGANLYGEGVSGINLFPTAADYPDGQCSTGGNLWFSVGQTSALPAVAEVKMAASPENRFYYDDSKEPESSSGGGIRAKLLGVGAPPEALAIEGAAPSGPFSCATDNPKVAAATLNTGADGKTMLKLNGLEEGETMLWIKSGTRLAGYMKLQVFRPRSMRLSYTYVQYPGESDHKLKTKETAAAIMKRISEIYAKANIAIDWTDNGVITHDWDYNHDGNSWEPKGEEQWSAMDKQLLPKPNDYFSNLFMIRFNKDDKYIGGSNGGGTSRGFGPGKPPRGALVRCHLFGGAAQWSSTLAHEVGHNLGLSHTGNNSPPLNNLMDVGRKGDDLYGWQWTIIHDTLKSVSGN